MGGTSYRARLRWAMALAFGGALAIGLVGGRLVHLVERARLLAQGFL